MKKIIAIAVSALLLFAGAGVAVWNLTKVEDAFFNENLEALMDAESHTTGSCEEEENACIGYCPGCGKMVEAMGNHKGPAGVIHHCQ